MKSDENQELESTEGLYPKNVRTDEIKNGISEIGNWEEKNKRKDLKCKPNKYLYDFQQFEAIRSSIYTRKINTDEAEMDQSNLLENMVKFNNKSKPTAKEVNYKNKVLFIKIEN